MVNWLGNIPVTWILWDMNVYAQITKFIQRLYLQHPSTETNKRFLKRMIGKNVFFWEYNKMASFQSSFERCRPHRVIPWNTDTKLIQTSFPLNAIESWMNESLSTNPNKALAASGSDRPQSHTSQRGQMWDKQAFIQYHYVHVFS